jgi:hypothetical protein
MIMINNTDKIIDKIPGINDLVNVGKLTFSLDNVFLSEWTPLIWEYPTTNISFSYPEKKYSLFFSLTVTNNGDSIENFTDCGVLLFEDGKKYNLEIIQACPTSKFDSKQYDYDISNVCNEYKMFPGEKMQMYSSFYFTNSSNTYVPPYWSDSPLIWEKVPGSKITYYSQQNSGIVKYVIDKSDIIYSIEPNCQEGYNYTEREANDMIINYMVKRDERHRLYFQGYDF